MQHLRIWYVVADGGHARIVTRDPDTDHFRTERAVDSSDLHHRSSELGADRPGRTHESASIGRHAQTPRSDPHEMAKQNFAAEVAALLNEEDRSGNYDRLVLVAPPQVLAVLEEGLVASARQKVGATLHKDLTGIPDGHLASHFADLRID